MGTEIKEGEKCATTSNLKLQATCGFAHPGTWGHECGRPASLVGLKSSHETTTGVFYAKRCAECAKIRGGENSEIREFASFNPELHINRWGPNNIKEN